MAISFVLTHFNRPINTSVLGRCTTGIDLSGDWWSSASSDLKSFRLHRDFGVFYGRKRALTLNPIEILKPSQSDLAKTVD